MSYAIALENQLRGMRRAFRGPEWDHGTPATTHPAYSPSMIVGASAVLTSPPKACRARIARLGEATFPEI